MPQFPSLEDRDNNGSFLVGLLLRVKRINEHNVPGMANLKSYINFCNYYFHIVLLSTIAVLVLLN